MAKGDQRQGSSRARGTVLSLRAGTGQRLRRSPSPRSVSGGQGLSLPHKTTSCREQAGSQHTAEVFKARGIPHVLQEEKLMAREGQTQAQVADSGVATAAPSARAAMGQEGPPHIPSPLQLPAGP